MTMKHFYTSNYSRHGNDLRSVAISRQPPVYYQGVISTILAPTWEIVTNYKRGIIDEDRYIFEYISLLEERKLTPKRVVNAFPERTIFLCYESPNDFCHRHVLAEWLNQSNVALVLEYTEREEYYKQQEFDW